jgi:hypothetical protein
MGGDGECKDFAKGVCFRGARCAWGLLEAPPNLSHLALHRALPSCKYRHEGDSKEPDTVPFCKDFQSDRWSN